MLQPIPCQWWIEENVLTSEREFYMTCLSQFWHLTMSHDSNTMSLSSDTWHLCVRLSQSDCRTSVGRWPIFRLLSCRLQQTKINSYLKYSLSLEIKRSIATRSLRGPLSTPEVLCCSSSTFISRTNDDDSRWTVTHTWGHVSAHHPVWRSVLLSVFISGHRCYTCCHNIKGWHFEGPFATIPYHTYPSKPCNR